MNQSFQFLQSIGARKNNCAQRFAIHCVLFIEYSGSEKRGNFFRKDRIGVKLADELVGVENARAEIFQERSDRTFSAGDVAGQSQDFHARSITKASIQLG